MKNEFFKEDKERAGHLVFLLLMTGSVKEDKERPDHFDLYLKLT